MPFATLSRRGAQCAPRQRKIIRFVGEHSDSLRAVYGGCLLDAHCGGCVRPTVQPVQMNLQTVCRGRTSGHPTETIVHTEKNIFGVDHSWSIFRTIRGIDKNENRTTALSFRINRAYSYAHRFFSSGKRDFSSGKRHFSSGKSTEQRRAEQSRGQNRRAEKSRA